MSKGKNANAYNNSKPDRQHKFFNIISEAKENNNFKKNLNILLTIPLSMTKRKVFHNRDIKIKVSLINHIQYFLDFLEIDEEIDVLLTNEIITDDFRNLRMDYVALCKSGMIIEAEVN